MNGLSGELDFRHILYFNAHCLLPKTEELRALCATNPPDIVCVVETWVDNSILDCELNIPGYSIVRHDRNKHGGGVFMFINNKLSLSCGPNLLEFMAITVHYPHCTNRCTVCVFFRPPSSPLAVLEALHCELEHTDPSLFSNFVLVGDLNINFLNTSHPLFSFVSDSLCSFSLTQCVPAPTHISPSGGATLIDLALISKPSGLLNCSVCPPLAYSDHKGSLSP